MVFLNEILMEKKASEANNFIAILSQFHRSDSAYVEFLMSVPRGVSVGLYARKNAVPTITNNDVRDVFSGFNSNNNNKRESRSASQQQTVSRKSSYYLERGLWFVSLYNDDPRPQRLTVQARESPELTRDCPSGCGGRGECVLGRCQCQAGFDGPDCGQSEYLTRLDDEVGHFLVKIAQNTGFALKVQKNVLGFSVFWYV